MNITHLKVTASRTFNHPFERYANFRFSIELSGALDPGEDFREASVSLRHLAEEEAENHKFQILTELENHRQRRNLSEQIARARFMPERLAKLEQQLEAELPEYSRSHAEYEIKQGKALLESLPALEAELAALPTPELLPFPEIHPGHPDHPATDDGDIFQP